MASLAYSLVSKGVSIPKPAVEMLSNVIKGICLRNLLERLQINCVLDVGAHEGAYVKTLRRIGFKGLVLSFEPNPNSFKVLSGSYSSDPLWKGYDVALGSRNTTMPFNLTQLSEMSSLLAPKTANVSGIENVVLKRLDAVVDKILTIHT